jgi:hypothetical protein
MSARSKRMTSAQQACGEARGGSGERNPQDSVRRAEAVGGGDQGQEAQPIRRLLVERLRQSIAAGDYLTSEKIDATLERL